MDLIKLGGMDNNREEEYREKMNLLKNSPYDRHDMDDYIKNKSKNYDLTFDKVKEIMDFYYEIKKALNRQGIVRRDFRDYMAEIEDYSEDDLDKLLNGIKRIKLINVLEQL
jgi:hypothetical protein